MAKWLSLPALSASPLFFIKRHYRYQCRECQHQTTATVETLLESTKVEVRVWFYAVYLITQAKNSISSMSLKRSLGVDYKTAWRIKHKLIMAMRESENKEPLSGTVHVDDAYIGGRKRASKRGRGAKKKPFVAAISMRKNKPFKAKFSVVKSFKQRDLAAWAKRHLTTGPRVMADSLAGFRGIEQAGMQYFSIITTGNQYVQDVVFRWVNTIHGNVKRAINGTYHAIRPAYVERYLVLFQFRFNHRFDLKRMMSKTIQLLVFTKPMGSEKILAEL